MPVKFYLIMGLVYIFIVLSFSIYIIRSDQKKRLKTSVGVALYKNQLHRNYSELIYRSMLRFPLTRGYIAKISRRYEMLCPGRPGDIAKKTMSLTGIAFGLCLAVLLLIFILHPSMEHFVLAIYVTYVINNEIINYYVNGAEIRLRKEQERFISNVGRNFFSNYYIDDAILKSMDSPMSKEMRVHAQALYDITISNNLKEEVERYNATSHDRFMKMLLSLCVNVVERSSGSEKENNMLAANLLHLKREINLDYLKMKRLQFVFSGSIFAAVAVCIPLSAIQEFGLYISPELVTFYKGFLGILYIGLIYLCSIIVYMLTNSAKEIKRPTIRNYRYLEMIEKNKLVKAALNNFNEKNFGRIHHLKDTLKRLGENITPNQLMINCTLLSLFTFLLCIVFVLTMHDSTKALLLKNGDDVGALSSAATEDQLSMVKETILYYTDKYKGEVVSKEELKTEIGKENNLRNELIREKIVDEVINRNKKYRKEYFKYYELLICIAISGIAFVTPYLLILYRKKLMLGIMDDEVVQFNSIIYMMMYSDYITVADILEQMEIFSIVFKTTIRECLNEYNSGDIEALERMRERETNDSFRHLVSNLIRCDDMPIYKAFNEIAADRENYFERRKQEDEFSIQRKADSIKPLAFLPGILVMIYLVLPVVVISLKALQDVLTLLQETGMY
jgi:ABC-type multidrug transport system fused ATPase/permease subunit